MHFCVGPCRRVASSHALRMLPYNRPDGSLIVSPPDVADEISEIRRIVVARFQQDSPPRVVLSRVVAVAAFEVDAAAELDSAIDAETE